MVEIHKDLSFTGRITLEKIEREVIANSCPQPFSFQNISNAEPFVVYSASSQLLGFDTPSTVNVSDGEIAISKFGYPPSSSEWTTNSTLINSDEYLFIRREAGVDPSQTVSASVTVGNCQTVQFQITTQSINWYAWDDTNGISTSFKPNRANHENFLPNWTSWDDTFANSFSFINDTVLTNGTTNWSTWDDTFGTSQSFISNRVLLDDQIINFSNWSSWTPNSTNSFVLDFGTTANSGNFTSNWSAWDQNFGNTYQISSNTVSIDIYDDIQNNNWFNWNNPNSTTYAFTLPTTAWVDSDIQENPWWTWFGI